ncbi:MAG: chemotaxis protein CheA, partial [Burkholderiales bacterium]
MNLDQALQTFFAESRELLDAMEAALLTMRQEGDNAETVNAIFRAAHTIKGSAGLFGLDPVVAFTHVVESVLDDVREGRVAISDALISRLLVSGDHIRALVDAMESAPGQVDPALIAKGEPLLAQLRAFLPQMPDSALVAVPNAGFERVAPAANDTDPWHISLRFGTGVLRNGMDPMAFLRYLGTIGTITGIVTLPDAMPADERMDPECCYLGFEIALRSKADKAAIESVFDFVLDDCTLRIVPPCSRIEEYIAVVQSLPDESSRLGEMLVRCGTVTAHELQSALRKQADAQTAAAHDDSPAPLLGDVLMQQGSVAAPVVAAALAKQQRVRDAKVQESQSVRVDADKLDHLINLVGELIIASAGANLIARKARHVELQEANSVLSALVEEVRDSALQLRMVKIGGTFSRFRRVVHDVSRELGKDIRLAVNGEDTELDKTVVEKIGDPLTHLVRNAMDHGIDSAELRVQRGKPLQGTVSLNAYHDSGSIVIEVSDDGGGLDRDKIIAKAQQRGLVESGKTLSDADIYGLVFEPGFSTAEKVTNLSGRGVGMDVVKRNITALRGSVGIHSVPGVGTTVTVRLPLTLAIINGFQIA